MKIAKDRKVIPDPIDDRKFHEWKESPQPVMSVHGNLLSDKASIIGVTRKPILRISFLLQTLSPSSFFNFEIYKSLILGFYKSLIFLIIL